MHRRRQQQIFTRVNLVGAAVVRDKKRPLRHHHQFKIHKIPRQMHPLLGGSLELAAEVVRKTIRIRK